MVESSQIWLWIGISVAAGAALYVFDRYGGVPLYRWFYNMTHEKPLPSEAARGFIYNRRARVKFGVACLLAAGQSVWAVLNGSNPFWEFLSFFLEVPLIMLGFYIGPWLFRLWERREDIFDTVDQIEGTDLSTAEDVKPVSTQTVEAVPEVATDAEAAGGATAEAIVAAEPAPEPPPTAVLDEPEDPRELVQRYLRKD